MYNESNVVANEGKQQMNEHINTPVKLILNIAQESSLPSPSQKQASDQGRDRGIGIAQKVESNTHKNNFQYDVKTIKTTKKPSNFPANTYRDNVTEQNKLYSLKGSRARPTGEEL